MTELKKIVLGMILLTLSTSVATAGEGNERHGGRGSHGGRGGPGSHHGGKKVFETCATSLGISLPEKGSKPPELSAAQKESMHTCMKASMDAKRTEIDACLKAAGVAFGEDGRPSTRPSREQMESCRPKDTANQAANATSAL